MPGIAISGVGVACGALRTNNVAKTLDTATKAVPDDAADHKAWIREVARSLAREDRAIVTGPTALCLRTAMDAFDLAERAAPIPPAQRENMSVYTSVERDREFPAELWGMVHHTERTEKPEVAEILARIGNLREVVHPLALFRKLSTNALYHLSKYFQLEGGGYPLQRMSLGGICMVEEAAAKIARDSCSGALLSAYGNMDTIDNRIAFTKMGMVRRAGTDSGIEPRAGAASVVVESLDRLTRRGGQPIAVIDRIASRFRNTLHVGTDDWLDFYRRNFADLEGTTPLVVRYDNGISEAGEAERHAIEYFFDGADTVGYKSLTGYTGQPNNLIDLVIALADPAVPLGRPVLLNGVGSSTGLGAILFRKLASVGAMTEKAA